MPDEPQQNMYSSPGSVQVLVKLLCHSNQGVFQSDAQVSRMAAATNHC